VLFFEEELKTVRYGIQIGWSNKGCPPEVHGHMGKRVGKVLNWATSKSSNMVLIEQEKLMMMTVIMGLLRQLLLIR